MKKPSKPEMREVPVIWERPDTGPRPAPSPLNREKIVAAAIALADRDGIAAVSLRKIGAALDAGPMRLYGHISTKEELLDLMADAVYGEVVSGEDMKEDWREAFRSFARLMREACHRHKWFIDLLGGRPHLGPNALAVIEVSLSALNDRAGFSDIDISMQALGTVNAYVIGAIRNETNDLKGGTTKADWQETWWPYLSRQIASGRFPMLEKVVKEANHPSTAESFETGLETVLDGIEVRRARCG